MWDPTWDATRIPPHYLFSTISTARERPFVFRIGRLSAAAWRRIHLCARLRLMDPPILRSHRCATKASARLALGVGGHVVADSIPVGHSLTRAIEQLAAGPWRRRWDVWLATGGDLVARAVGRAGGKVPRL